MTSVAPEQAGGPKLDVDPDFEGPCKKRRCTDVLLLLLLLATWVGMTVLGLVGIGTIDQCSNGLSPGEPKRLYNGIDYTGSVCGVNNTEPPCPNATLKAGMRDHTNRSFAYTTTTATKYVICVHACPTADGIMYDYDGGGAGLALETTAVGSYCIPTAASMALNSSYGTQLDAMDKFAADVSNAQAEILGLGFGLGILIGFAVLAVMRIPFVLGALVWAMILGVGGAFALTGVFLVTESSDQEDAGKDSATVDTLKYAGYLFFGFTAVYAVVILFLRNRIKLAIGVVKEAARAIGSTPLLILFPVLQSVGLLLFMALWVYYGSYLASAGELVALSPTQRVFTYSENMRYALLYHLFAFFWTSQFIVAVGQLVVALAVSTWYFTRDKGVSNAPFFRAMYATFRFHLGTAAFGSLIIAIIETIRAVLSYVQKKAAKAGDGTAAAKVLQVVLCCLQCCLWCMKKCMQFINKNAYIQTAIFGTSFCTSARKAFMLILRNVSRVAAVSFVGNFVLLLFKLLVAFGTSFVAYVYFAGSMDQLNNPIGPALVVLFIAYAVACVFSEVFGMAISTVLQCFVADEEMCNGSFAENDLKKWISAHGEHKGASSQVEPEG